jgi:small GTP-binding protein
MSRSQRIGSRQPDYLFKICLIGDGGVGKTCIARRLCHNSFSLDTQLTVGIDFYTFEYSVIAEGEENRIKLLIWDFGGQEQFKALFKSYIMGVNGMFFVFDLLRMESLMKLDWWYDRIKEYNLENVPKIMIGTKLDLATLESEHLKVDRLVVEQFLKRHSEKDYLETSAKDNINISMIFQELIQKIFDYQDFIGQKKITFKL